MKTATKILSLVMTAFFFTDCIVEEENELTTSSSSSSSITATSIASGSTFSANNALYIDLDNEKVSVDNTDWASLSDTETSLFSETVTVTKASATSLIKIDAQEITENLAIYFTGTQTSGGVKIQTSTDHEVGVYLDNISITSTNYPCIDITKGGAATVFLTGENTLKDGRNYSSDYSSSGSDNKGTLFCKGGISLCGDGSLTITQNYKSCIASKGNISIENGTYTLTSTAVAVYDSSESDYNSPALINCDGNITIKGGSVSGTASGKGSKAITVDGTYTQSDGMVNVKATGSKISSGSASASAKGVKVDGAINVSGGKLYASSASHEAIESKSTITITGGEVYGYSAADDGINAASDFTISGGYVCGYALNNDGLDANGNLYIKGGVVYAVGSTTPEKSIDANTEGGYKLYISGGVVMALGPLENGSSLTQSCYSASSWSANTIYGLTVGSTTYTFKTPSSTKGYGSGIVVSGNSTPTLTSGATAGSATYFDGLVSVGGTAGNTSVSLSSYSSGSSTTTGGGTTPPNNGGQQGGGFGRP